MRPGWVLQSFCRFTEDLGQEYALNTMSPAALRNVVVESVRRWQVRRVAWVFLQQGLADGVCLKPLFHLLRADEEGWGPSERGQLRSAVVGGQWTQERLYPAGCRLYARPAIRRAVHWLTDSGGAIIRR